MGGLSGAKTIRGLLSRWACFQGGWFFVSFKGGGSDTCPTFFAAGVTAGGSDAANIGSHRLTYKNTRVNCAKKSIFANIRAEFKGRPCSFPNRLEATNL